MKSQDLAKFNLPDAPGVYYFLDKGGSVLYVGKATSLKDRVKSYFSKDIFLTRGPKILKMLEEAESVEYRETPSVLEALILEANEIKRLQPTANSRDKDDKSYNYVVVTKEEFPRLLTVRGRSLFVKENNELGIKNKEIVIHNSSFKIQAFFGPFPHSGELREALKIVRKIFPYRDEKCKITLKLKPCFNAQIGLCPGPCANRVSKKEYAKTIRHISLFFEGKKEKLIGDLEKEMKILAKDQKFEEAEEKKRQIFALDHIQDVALIKKDLEAASSEGSPFRIEAYDIAHLSGKDVVGVMVVIEDGEKNQSQYRKFKLRFDKNDDVNNLKEIVERRFNHPEWFFPDLIVVDGGLTQLKAAKDILKDKNLDIEVVSVVKDERHKAREILNPTRKDLVGLEKAVFLANAEAHRFAIGYHRKLRSKGFRI